MYGEISGSGHTKYFKNCVVWEKLEVYYLDPPFFFFIFKSDRMIFGRDTAHPKSATFAKHLMNFTFLYLQEY